MTELLDRLRELIGSAHVLDQADDMERYLREERGLYRGNARAIVRPGSTEEVSAVVAALAEAGVAMVPQGGNTGLCGGGVPLNGAVVISTERLTRIRTIDPVNYTMTVEAGCILSSLQQAAEAEDRLFPLSLAAEGSCRIGGNLSTNAGGLAVLRYGNARDLVLGLEVVLPDGRIWNGLRSLRKDNTGYDLKHLFIGGEGTLGIITAAVLKLFPRPREEVTAFIALPDPNAALTLLANARTASGDAVTACELVPRIGLELTLAHMPGIRDPLEAPAPWYLLLEMSSSRPGGLREALESVVMQALEDGVALDAVLAESGEQRAALWRIRESIPEAQKREGGSIKHDVSVSTSLVPELLERAMAAVRQAMPGIRPVPFGHIGDGNIHFNLTQPVDADRAWFIDQWGDMNRIVHDIVTDLGGSISAEHGIGLLKTGEMGRYKSPIELEMMRRIKTALDPRDVMNPGKILPV